jgi:hypothetical protein
VAKFRHLATKEKKVNESNKGIFEIEKKIVISSRKKV